MDCQTYQLFNDCQIQIMCLQDKHFFYSKNSTESDTKRLLRLWAYWFWLLYIYISKLQYGFFSFSFHLFTLYLCACEVYVNKWVARKFKLFDILFFEPCSCRLSFKWFHRNIRYGFIANSWATEGQFTKFKLPTCIKYLFGFE